MNCLHLAVLKTKCAEKKITGKAQAKTGIAETLNSSVLLLVK